MLMCYCFIHPSIIHPLVLPEISALWCSLHDCTLSILLLGSTSLVSSNLLLQVSLEVLLSMYARVCKSFSRANVFCKWTNSVLGVKRQNVYVCIYVCMYVCVRERDRYAFLTNKERKRTSMNFLLQNSKLCEHGKSPCQLCGGTKAGGLGLALSQ